VSFCVLFRIADNRKASIAKQKQKHFNKKESVGELERGKRFYCLGQHLFKGGLEQSAARAEKERRRKEE
jgi:hypothetical protein